MRNKYSPQSFGSMNVAKNHLATASGRRQAAKLKTEQLLRVVEMYEMWGGTYIELSFWIHKL